MALEAVWIGFAYILGFLAKAVRLPALVGYLGAGFAISALSVGLGLPEHNAAVLNHVGHLGVLLLLFTIGLKLNIRSLIRREVIGPGLLHFSLSLTLFGSALLFFGGVEMRTAILLAVALSFSSTVLSAKSLEGAKELKAFHGRLAIGILILQDIIALVTISLSTGSTPSPWAFLILLLPLLRPLLFWLLDASGKEDLLVLYGLLVALVVGGFGFESLGLNSELGALLLGFTISGHRKAEALYQKLWSVKEFFLIAFFLQIGIGGLPSQQDWFFAALFTLMLPLKGILFFFLFIIFKLRARSAFLAGLSLTAYSEFGLILSYSVLSDWLTPLALTVALSFMISSAFNRYSHQIFENFYDALVRWERHVLHPDEQPISLKDYDILVMGLGRVGTAAYEKLEKDNRVVAIDSDPARVAKHRQAGRNVRYADAEDHSFWEKLQLNTIQGVVLAISGNQAKIFSIKKLRERGFSGAIVTNSMDANAAEKIAEVGADTVHLTMSEAGVSLADALLMQIPETNISAKQGTLF